MGVRPTQLTIKKPAFDKFRPDSDLFLNFKICMNVEMCEMCRPDTHALIILIKPICQILGLIILFFQFFYLLFLIHRFCLVFHLFPHPVTCKVTPFFGKEGVT